MPFFSVVIPFFNRSHFLPRAIQSVRNQTFQDFQLILVDDGSNKNEQIETKDFPSNTCLIRLETNQGVSKARNLGVQKAKGKWIAFLDSDDEWLPKKLEKQFAYIQKNPDQKIHQTQEIWIRNKKRVNAKQKHQKKDGDLFLPSLELCLITASSVVIEREFLIEKKGFDEKLRACEDYDLWLRITAETPVGLIPENLLVRYGGHADQLSAKYLAMDRFRVYSMLKLLFQTNLSDSMRQATKNVLSKKLSYFLNGLEKRETSIPPHIHQEINSLQNQINSFDWKKLGNWLINNPNFQSETC